MLIEMLFSLMGRCKEVVDVVELPGTGGRRQKYGRER